MNANTLTKTHRYTTSRVNPIVNYEFWVIMMCSVGSSAVTKYHSGGGCEGGEAVGVSGSRG